MKNEVSYFLVPSLWQKCFLKLNHRRCGFWCFRLSSDYRSFMIPHFLLFAESREKQKNEFLCREGWGDTDNLDCLFFSKKLEIWF